MIWPAALALLDEIVASTFDDVSATARGRTRDADVNAATIDDTGRESFTFQCSITLAPPSTTSGPSPADPVIRPGAAITYGAVMTANSAAWPWEPRREDLIEAGGRVWQIAATERHGTNRFVAYLNRAR